MTKGMQVNVAVIDDLVPELSGYEQRQARYRESDKNKKARDMDRRQKRKNKRSQAY